MISSFRANGDVGVRRARSWQHFQSGGFSLDYPVGWMADFTSSDLAVLVGPFDQAYVVGEEMAYGGPTWQRRRGLAGNKRRPCCMPRSECRRRGADPESIDGWARTKAAGARACV